MDKLEIIVAMTKKVELVGKVDSSGIVFENDNQWQEDNKSKLGGIPIVVKILLLFSPNSLGYNVHKSMAGILLVMHY